MRTVPQVQGKLMITYTGFPRALFEPKLREGEVKEGGEGGGEGGGGESDDDLKVMGHEGHLMCS